MTMNDVVMLARVVDGGAGFGHFVNEFWGYKLFNIKILDSLLTEKKTPYI